MAFLMMDSVLGSTAFWPVVLAMATDVSASLPWGAYFATSRDIMVVAKTISIRKVKTVPIPNNVRLSPCSMRVFCIVCCQHTLFYWDCSLPPNLWNIKVILIAPAF